MKQRPTHKKCRHCGEWFSFSKRARLTQKFCSLSCSSSFRNAQPKWKKAQSQKIKAKTDPKVMRARARALWRDPEIRARLTEERRARSNTKEHRAHMAEHNEKIWADPEFRKKQSKRAKKVAAKLWADPAFREKISATTTEANKQRWADPDFKKKTSFRIRVTLAQPLQKKRRSKQSRERMQRPEERARVSQQAKEQWQDPQFRALVSENSREAALRNWRDPAYRAKNLPKLLKAARSPETRARMTEFNKQNWADPEYVARKKAWWTPERKAEQAEKNARQWSDPEYKARVSKKISEAKRRARGNPKP